MKGQIILKNNKYEIEFSKGFDISIPMIFNGSQPNTYGVDKAILILTKTDEFIGDTRKGGPCNFETYTFTPHCNGTHTECIGHITEERISILTCLNDELLPATLISVIPKKTSENYFPNLNEEDKVITKEEVKERLKNINPDFLKAIIVRTLPNTENKKNPRLYEKYSFFFSIEAMEYLVSLGVQHLLVDTPSVDRLFDDGQLTAHNIFWETKGKVFNPNKSKQNHNRNDIYS